MPLNMALGSTGPWLLVVWAFLSWREAEGTVMPDGRDYPEECIHRLESWHRVETAGAGDILTDLATGERRELPRCTRGSVNASSDTATSSGYYSDWIMDAKSVHKSIASFSSTWKVPKAPMSRGPVTGISSVYLFNGLEDGRGVPGEASMILQPVLSYGKSGCVLNPLAAWRFTAFQVTMAGRAYCGPVIEVTEGDQLTGTMSKANGEWLITADAGHRGRSTHSVAAPSFEANAAYLTLEGMVIYSCKALPSDGGITFAGNTLKAEDGAALDADWQTTVRHAECRPGAAHVEGSQDVQMTWETGAQEMVV